MNLEGLSSNYREPVHNNHLGQLWLFPQSLRWLGTTEENREATDYKGHHILDEPCPCHISLWAGPRLQGILSPAPISQLSLAAPGTPTLWA